MVVPYSNPIRRITVTHSSTDYYIEGVNPIIDLRMRENAVDTLQFSVVDADSTYYSDILTTNDRVRVYIDYADRSGAANPPTQLVFDGYIDEVSPTRDPTQGDTLTVDARQVGRSLLYANVGQDYGTQSLIPNINSLYEIITDSTDGIIHAWVNKVLSGAQDTGYSLGHDSGGTDYIATIVGEIQYLYHPYEPAKKCLDDLMDLVQAIKGTNAGPHYIVTPTNYLCVATVGNHEAGPAAIWPTWWNTNQAGSTLVEGTDFQGFNFTKKAAEANYVLYHGVMRKPLYEVWTEYNGTDHGSADWTSLDAGITKFDENGAGNHPTGSYSVRFHVDDLALGAEVQVPSAAQSWEINKWGGKFNIPTLTFQYKYADQMINATIRLYSGANYFYYTFFDAAAGTSWHEITLPLGPYWNLYKNNENFTGWSESGAPSWGDIDYIRLLLSCTALQTGEFYIDGLQMNGWVLRAATRDYDGVAPFTAADPLKSKLITDDVAKDDSGLSTGTSYPMAQLAYAEYLRSKTTPLQGSITIPGQPTIMAGQLCHIHAKKNVAGTYLINSDFRIQEHRLHLDNGGLISTLSLTDDVTNGRARPPTDSYNIMMKAVNPDFQTRQVASLKTRDLDITQAIMEAQY